MMEKGFFKIGANTPTGLLVVEGNGFPKSRSERNQVSDKIFMMLSNMIDTEVYEKVKMLMNSR